MGWVKRRLLRRLRLRQIAEEMEAQARHCRGRDDMANFTKYGEFAERVWEVIGERRD